MQKKRCPKLFGHPPRLLFFARKLLNYSSESEDCVMISFHNLWLNRFKIKAASNAKAFLYTAVKNRCLNVIRHNKAIIKVEIDENFKNNVIDTNDIELAFVDAELHTLLHKSIGQLPSDVKKVLILNVFEKVKMHEIAEQMGISLNKVKALKTKAMNELKKDLGSKYMILCAFFNLNLGID